MDLTRASQRATRALLASVFSPITEVSLEFSGARDERTYNIFLESLFFLAVHSRL